MSARARARPSPPHALFLSSFLLWCLPVSCIHYYKGLACTIGAPADRMTGTGLQWDGDGKGLGVFSINRMTVGWGTRNRSAGPRSPCCAAAACSAGSPETRAGSCQPPSPEPWHAKKKEKKKSSSLHKLMQKRNYLGEECMRLESRQEGARYACKPVDSALAAPHDAGKGAAVRLSLKLQQGGEQKKTIQQALNLHTSPSSSQSRHFPSGPPLLFQPCGRPGSQSPRRKTDGRRCGFGGHSRQTPAPAIKHMGVQIGKRERK